MYLQIGGSDMGYNFFNTKEVPENSGRKLDEFKASLGSAISKGNNITFADSDVSNILKLQHDRIRRKGLEIDYNI